VSGNLDVDGRRLPDLLGEGLAMKQLAEVFGRILQFSLVAAFVGVGIYWMFVMFSSEAIRARGGLWILPAPFVLAVVSYFAVGWVRKKAKSNRHGIE
jgi:hypothetical protein